jgi:hypothetical protein
MLYTSVLCGLGDAVSLPSLMTLTPLRELEDRRHLRQRLQHLPRGGGRSG